MKRFQPWWTDDSPGYRDCTGYRIRDTRDNVDVGFINCIAGLDRRAKRSRDIAFNLANAQCDKLNQGE